MAKGADTDEYRDISHVRPGLKRELEFALKSKAEYASSIGRTRTRRSYNEGLGNAVLKEYNYSNKRMRVSDVKNVKGPLNTLMNDEDVENNKVRNVIGDDVERTNCATDEEPKIMKFRERRSDYLKAKPVVRFKGSKCNPMRKSEKKMLKKIASKKSSMKLKELLGTGFLEGMSVRYQHGAKSKEKHRDGLEGIISGPGIVCFCLECDGIKVVSANKFEIHAHSLNKRPSDYIYLKNGKTLRHVLNACEDAPLESLGSIIQHICSSTEDNIFCQNCKSFITGGGGEEIPLCRSCKFMEKTKSSLATTSDMKISQLARASTLDMKEPKLSPALTLDKKKRSRTTPSSKTTTNAVAGTSKPKGKITKKDLGLHKLVFQNDILPDETELIYYARGQKRAKGRKRGFGILCGCCNTEVSPSQFEAHAGCASRRKPYLNIYTSNGVSLHELALKVSNLRKLTEEENDDRCSVCLKGGDLFSCDNCPRAFHVGCVQLPCIPTETWYCRCCKNMMVREKFVETNANAIAAGRIAGTDPLEEITKRCIRILGSLEADAGGCVLCRDHEFSTSGFGPKTVIICDQCEKEYHVGCLEEHGIDDLKELPAGKWFCCKDCCRIHSVLEELVASGDCCLPESLLSIVKTNLEEKGYELGADLDISWRLLSGKRVPEAIEESKMLSEAGAIFHERFDPLADPNSGVSDLIPHMVFGRKVRNQDFGGMHCAVLKVNSNIVCAGIIRIFGEGVAELPLIATSTEYQGQGYFQVLFSCVENLLAYLSVKNLVLPAADDAEFLWRKKFKFNKMSNEELTNYRKDYQLMIFQGTVMLHKSVVSS